MSRIIRFFVLLSVMLVSACCRAPEQKVDLQAEPEAIHARCKALVEAEVAQDIDRTIEFYAADAIIQPPSSPQVQGREAISEDYRRFFAAIPIKEFSSTTSHLTVSQAGDLAFEYGINRIVLHSPDGDLLDMGKYLVVWKKVAGEWYVAAISFTNDAPQPVPASQE